MADGQSEFTAYVGEAPDYEDSVSFGGYGKRNQPLPGGGSASVSTTTFTDASTGETTVSRHVELNYGPARVDFDLVTGETEGSVRRGPFRVGVTDCAFRRYPATDSDSIRPANPI